MNNRHWILIISGLVLLAILFFMPIKNKSKASNSSNLQVSSASNIIQQIEKEHTGQEMSNILVLKDLISAETNDSLKTKYMEQLSGAWFSLGEPAAAGVYAQQIAEKVNSEDTWSIAGTTFSYGLKSYQDNPTIRLFCKEKAVECLENAISINPEETQHRINLALCYVDMPPEDQPMKGILMLRDLLDKDPNNAPVLIQLAQLAIKTGQYDKAVERLEKAYSIQPDNLAIVQRLIIAYEGKGDTENALKYRNILNQ